LVGETEDGSVPRPATLAGASKYIQWYWKGCSRRGGTRFAGWEYRRSKADTKEFLVLIFGRLILCSEASCCEANLTVQVFWCQTRLLNCSRHRLLIALSPFSEALGVKLVL